MSGRPVNAILPFRARTILGVCVVIVLGTLGFLLKYYVPHVRREAVAHWRAQMMLTANDRGRDLERAIDGAYADAEMIANYPTARFLATHEAPPHGVPDPNGAEPHLRELLANSMRLRNMNNVWILDEAGATLTSAYPRAAVPDAARALAMEIARSGRRAFQQTGEDDRARSYFGAPIRSQRSGAVVGAAVVELLSAEALFTIVTASWDATHTGEVLLVQRRADTVDIMTPTRKPGSPRRYAAANTKIASVAALTGRRGFGEYRDYNGDDVFAVTRPIKNVPWALVTEVDRSEALVQARRESLGVGLTIFALLAAMAGVAYAAVIELRSQRQLQEARENERRALSELEIQEAQQRYEALNARAHALLEANVVGVAIGTADGRILEANDYYLNMLGYTRADVRENRLRWIDATPPEHLASDRRALAELQTRGVSTPYEKEYIRKDGTRVWVLVGDTLLPGPENEILAFVIDISTQKSLEAQYQQAQKMEAVGRLAGGVAHDFNNILTAIKGIASLAIEDCHPNDPIYKDLRDIDSFADRATALTKQLLAFSRRQVLQPTVFDLRTLLDGLDRMLCRLIGEDIDLVLALPDQPATIHADPGQIEQVILNLAVNARDAMPDGGNLRIEAEVIGADEVPRTLRNDYTAERMVRLRVTDTGCGMTEEVQRRLFEPFFTTKDVNKGTGLGLATVYGVVKQSHGAIEVNSTLGEGTTFVVMFPHVVATLSPQYKVKAPVRTHKAATLLLVEDDAAVRALTRRTIERKGHRVLQARDAEEAMGLVERHFHELDAIITDLVMPGISGREMVRRIREKHGSIKAIFMSGYTADVMDDMGQLDGAFLEKPFTPSQLLSAIENAVVSAGTLS